MYKDITEIFFLKFFFFYTILENPAPLNELEKVFASKNGSSFSAKSTVSLGSFFMIPI